MARKIAMRSADGRPRKISVLEAIFLKVAEDALKGNTKSAAFLLNRFGTLVSGEIQAASLADDDRAVLESFVAKLKSSKDEGEKK